MLIRCTLIHLTQSSMTPIFHHPLSPPLPPLPLSPRPPSRSLLFSIFLMGAPDYPHYSMLFPSLRPSLSNSSTTQEYNNRMGYTNCRSLCYSINIVILHRMKPMYKQMNNFGQIDLPKRENTTFHTQCVKFEPPLLC